MKNKLVILVVLIVVSVLIITSCTSTTTPSTTPATASSAPASTTAKPATTSPSTTQTATTASKPVAAEPKTLKLSYGMPKGRSIAQGFDWFAVEFPKRTEGRYKIETYPGGLVTSQASLDATKKGIVQIAMTSISAAPTNWPLNNVIALPTIGFPNEKINDFSAQKAWWELYNRFPEVQAEFKDIKPLWLNPSEPMFLITKKKEIHTPADFKGVKVGGTGATVDLAVASGAVGVQQLPQDSYVNLDKGVIEAAFSSFSWIRTISCMKSVIITIRKNSVMETK